MTPRLPEDLDTERSLLATLAASGNLDPGTLHLECQQSVLAMRPEFFMHPAHRAIALAIQRLYGEQIEIHSLSIRTQLEQDGELSRCGGYTGIVEVLQCEEVQRPSFLLNRLQELWRGRQIIRLGGEAIRRGQDAMEPIDKVISELADQLSRLASGGHLAVIRTGEEILKRLRAGEAFMDQSSGRMLVHFGIAAIDEAIEAAPGDVITVGGRPAVGKTAIAVQGICESAMLGHHTLLVSLEMDKDEIDARVASWMTRTPYSDFRRGTWQPSSVEALLNSGDTAKRIASWCSPSGVSWSKVEAAIRQSVRVHGTTSVWIDHVLLVGKPLAGKGSSDAACWSELSRGIKRLAQELGICIVNLIQLNRHGAEGEPRLHDLKESGAWEEDADAVLLLWNKDSAASEAMVEFKSVMVKGAKNRSGPNGWKREMNFQGSTNRFDEAVRTSVGSPNRQGRSNAFAL